jgi:hypothetical protein
MPHDRDLASFSTPRDPDRPGFFERRRQRTGRSFLADALVAAGSGPAAFVTSIGAGLAGITRAAIPSRFEPQILKDVQTGLARRSELVSRQGFRASAPIALGSRLAAEAVGIAAPIGVARGSSVVGRTAAATGLTRGVAGGVTTAGRTIRPGVELTRRGAILSSTPTAVIQAFAGEEASTVGALGQFAPEGSRTREVTETIARSTPLRVASEFGLDVVLGGVLDVAGRAISRLRKADEVIADAARFRNQGADPPDGILAAETGIERTPLGPERQLAPPKTEIDPLATLREIQDRPLAAGSDALGEVELPFRARLADIELDEAKRFRGGVSERLPNNRENAQQTLEDILGEDSAILRGRGGRRPKGVPDPAGYAIQFKAFGADNGMLARIFRRYEEGLASGAIPAKVEVGAEATTNAGKLMGFDEITKALLNPNLDDIMMKSLATNFMDNARKLENAIVLMEEIRHVANAPRTPIAEGKRLIAQADAIEQNIARWNVEQDTYARIYVSGASQFGRNLASLKQTANQTVDPLFWEYKLSKIAGRALTIDERGRMQIALKAVEQEADRSLLIALGEELAPSIKVFRSFGAKPVTAWAALGNPLITATTGAVVGAATSEDDWVTGALTGAVLGGGIALNGAVGINRLRRAGLLTGGRTQARNFLSNAAEGGLRHIERPAAAGADRLASLVASAMTGGRSDAVIRTRLGWNQGMGRASARGAKGGLRKAIRVMSGRDTLDTGIEAGGAGVDVWKRKWDELASGRAQEFENPFLESVVSGIFRLQGAADAPFRFAAFWESIQEQAVILHKRLGTASNEVDAAVRKLVDNPSDDMIQLAKVDSEEAVFLQKNVIAEALNKMEGFLARRAAGEGGVKSTTAAFARDALTFIVPFRRTPLNVVARLAERLPPTAILFTGKRAFDLISFLKTIDADSAFDVAELARLQKKFATSASRMAGGALMTFLGYKLAEMGLMSGGWPSSSREKALWRQQGKTPDSILFNGAWHRITGISPTGNLMAFGASYLQRLEEEGGNEIRAGIAAGASVPRTIVEQSFLRGFKEVINGLTEEQSNPQRILGRAAGSFVPTIVADIAQAVDPALRRGEGVGEGIARRIPGLTGAAARLQDPLGRDIDVDDRLGRMIDPTMRRREPTDRVMRLARRFGLVFPTARRASDESEAGFRRRNRIEGRELQIAAADMFDSDRFRDLDSAGKQLALRSLSNQVRGRLRDNDLEPPNSWTSAVNTAIGSAFQRRRREEQER